MAWQSHDTDILTDYDDMAWYEKTSRMILYDNDIGNGSGDGDDDDDDGDDDGDKITTCYWYVLICTDTIWYDMTWYDI